MAGLAEASYIKTQNALKRGFLAGKQEGKGAETTKIAKNAKNGLKID